MVRSHQGSTPQVTTGSSDQDWRHSSHVSIMHVLGSEGRVYLYTVMVNLLQQSLLIF